MHLKATTPCKAGGTYLIAEDIQAHWRIVQPLFSIRDEAAYDKAVATLNALIDEVGTDEQHPLYELLDTLGTVIHAYEEKHYSIPECSGVEVLQFLMKEHQLEPSELPELGPSRHCVGNPQRCAGSDSRAYSRFSSKVSGCPCSLCLNAERRAGSREYGWVSLAFNRTY